MALSVGEVYSGGEVRDADGRMVVAVDQDAFGALVTTGSPNLSGVQLEAVAPLFPRLMQDLNLAQRDRRMMLICDSVGVDGVATGADTRSWFHRLAVTLGPLFPAYTVNFYTWTDSGFTGSFSNTYEVDTLHLVSGGSGSTILNFTWRGLVYTTAAINYGATAATVANAVNNALGIPGAFVGSGGTFGSSDVTLTAQGPLLGPLSNLGHADTTLVCTFTQTTPGTSGTLLQTGTNGASSPVLDILNAAIGGTNATWFTGQRLPALATLQPHGMIVSFGANSLTDTTLTWWNPYLNLCEELLYQLPHSELGLIAEHPLVAPAASAGPYQQQRATDVFRIGKLLGAPVINLCQAFLDTGASMALYLNSTDGTHPNGPPSGTYPTNLDGMGLWATIVGLALTKGLYAKAPPPTVPARAKTASSLIQNGAMAIDGGGNLTGWTLGNVTVAQDLTNFERTAQGYAAKLTGTGSNAYITQTLDVKQCAGKWVTMMVRYYAPSAQTDNALLGRFQIGDTVKTTSLCTSASNGQQRDVWATGLVSVFVDPNATSASATIFATTGSTVGSTISVQDVTVVIGQEPMGLPLQQGPTGATGATGGPVTDPLLPAAVGVAPKILLPLAADLLDVSGNSHNGAQIGAQSFGTGRVSIAKALTFDGSTNYVTTTYSPFTTGGASRTFFGLAYRTNHSAAHALFGGSVTSGSHAPLLQLMTGNQNVKWLTDVASDGTGATWTAAWPGDAQWVAWALIAISLTSAELYINGVSKGVVADTADYTTANNLQIGARGGVTFFNGSQAMFGVVESALTASQIGKVHGYITGAKSANVALTALIAQAVATGFVMTDATS